MDVIRTPLHPIYSSRLRILFLNGRTRHIPAGKCNSLDRDENQFSEYELKLCISYGSRLPLLTFKGKYGGGKPSRPLGRFRDPRQIFDGNEVVSHILHNDDKTS